MKGLSVTCCFIFCFGICNAQSNANYTGYYTGKDYKDYIILTTNNDSIFFDGHTEKTECFGCNVKMIQGKLIYIGTNNNDSGEIKLSNYNKSLSFLGSSYKKSSLSDTLYSYSDTLYFYVGLGYLVAAKSPNNSYRKTALLRTSISYFKKSVTIRKVEEHTYIDYGLAYYELGMPDSTKILWDKGRKLRPDDPLWTDYYKNLGKWYLRKGAVCGQNKDYDGAMDYFKKGIEVSPTDAELWYNLGGAAYTAGKYKKAKEAWLKTLQLDPDYPNAQSGLDAIGDK